MGTVGSIVTKGLNVTYEVRAGCFLCLVQKVHVADGSELPLQMVCYMKCEQSITNFRLDYSYHPSTFHQSDTSGSSSSSSPRLSGVSFSVPVDGGVKNALTKPTGKWLAETSHMTWTVGDVLPVENPSEFATVVVNVKQAISIIEIKCFVILSLLSVFCPSHLFS